MGAAATADRLVLCEDAKTDGDMQLVLQRSAREQGFEASQCVRQTMTRGQLSCTVLWARQQRSLYSRGDGLYMCVSWLPCRRGRPIL